MATVRAVRHSSSMPSAAKANVTIPTQRYLLYFTVPLWVVAKIETTSGTLESAIHALMMTEAGIPIVLGLVLQINAGVILLMIASFFAHAGTAIWEFGMWLTQ